MDRNLLLAVVLSMAVYVGWFAYMERVAPKPAVPAAGAPAAGAVAPHEGGVVPSAPPKAPERLLDLTAPQAAVGFNPNGASIGSYRFQGPLGLVELVPAPAPGTFSTWPGLAFKPAAARWPHSSAFEAKHPDGFMVRKEFRFGARGELNLLRVEFKNPERKPLDVPAWEVNLGPGLGTVASEQADNLSTMRAIALFPPAEGKKQPRLEVIDEDDKPRDWKWLAIDNRYFMLAAFPDRRDFSTYQRVTGADKTPGIKLTASPERLAPGAVSGHDIPFYLGPKDYPVFQEMKQGLEKAIDFGWFDSIGRGLLWVMRYLKNLTGNYGWAIILLTVALQTLLFPLTLKSIQSASTMRKLQPELTKLQQKYAKDPTRLNQEMMALYRARGANPMGGCLPMLLQLPVFVALFNALRNAWELHGSPWIGWIHDLSAQDPYYVLPVIMGGVMFVQNKVMMVPSADPMQAKMMQFMPLIFVFMFLKFPSGLVLYWLTSSLINAAVQLALTDRGPDLQGGAK
ncbi:MAG: membrane protein insertase YidC [Elusimicrobia bacterium]|nr:membrane protein insertase YidC [Elusimicrobiota bacterium]